MKDNVFSPFASRLAAAAPKREPEPEEDAGGEESLGAFGLLRGVRDRAVMLELRRRDGSMVAFNYAWLERIDFDASDGIVLKFGGHTVKIAGRNLGGGGARLLDGICRHRVPWIQESDSAAERRADRTATIIEQIEVDQSA